MIDDYIQHPDQIQGGAALTVLCKAIGDRLQRHYPGWLWVIAPEKDGGVLSIFSLRLSGEWGYRFRLTGPPGKDLLSDDAKVAGQQVMRAAGEILERFHVPRGTYRYQDWRDAPKFAGMAKPDLSDKPLFTRKADRDAMLSRALQFGTAGLRVTDVPTETGTRRHVHLEIRE